MEKKIKNTKEILKDVKLKRSKKKFFIILVVSILIVLGIVIFSLFSYYSQISENTIGLGAEIEALEFLGNTAYIRLAGGSNNKIIKSINFVFKDEAGNSYTYKTVEGISEIKVPYKKSFWDWLFGRNPYQGVYDYDINADDIMLMILRGWIVLEI